MSVTLTRSRRETCRDARSRLPSERSVVADGTVASIFARRRWRSADAKLSHPIDERRSFHPELFGSAVLAADHPVAGLERTQNMVTLHLCKHSHRILCLFVSNVVHQLG